MTRTQMIDIARDLLDCVPDQYQASRAYVYGSQARGDADALSDLDILVICGSVSTPLKGIMRNRAWELSLAHERLISLVLVSESDFETGPLSVSGFVRNIRKEGFEVAA